MANLAKSVRDRIRNASEAMTFVHECRRAGLGAEAIQAARVSVAGGMSVESAVAMAMVNEAQAKAPPSPGMNGIWIDEVPAFSDADVALCRDRFDRMGGTVFVRVVSDRRDRRDLRDIRRVINRGLRRLARFGD